MKTKKVKLALEECNGNAFVLLGRFGKEAKRQGWTDAEMAKVTEEAKSGNYDHLLQTLLDYVESPDSEA